MTGMEVWSIVAPIINEKYGGARNTEDLSEAYDTLYDALVMYDDNMSKQNNDDEDVSNVPSLAIYFKDGEFDTWTDQEYTDYEYRGDVFIVIDGLQWVGVYSMDEIRKIIVYRNSDVVDK